MCEWIRGLPNLTMLIVIFAFGFLGWALFIAAVFAIDNISKKWKRSLHYQYVRLQQENAYLKRKLQEEHSHGNTKKRT